MKINPYIFREYDIRGLVGKDLNKDTVKLIGKGFGILIQKISGKNVVIGKDNRESSTELQAALIEGLIEVGCEVTTIEFSTSPMLYFAVCNYGFDGGINVTGSHNPIEFNGLKLTQKNAVPVYGKELKGILKIIEEGFVGSGEVEGSKNKKGKLIEENKHVKEDYLNAICDRIKLNPGKKLKVVVDCGNGTASYFAPEMLRKIGCEVVELYCEPDSTFPNHLPDPAEEKYMEDLKKKVLEEKADLGIAYDGDADRCGIVNEKGQLVHPDFLLILLARDFLGRNPGEKVIFEVKCSENVKSEIEKSGGKAVVWKAGHSLIKDKMKKDKILLGGEASGHMFFGENYFGFDDGLYASAKILEIYSKAGKAFSEHFLDIPKVYATPEIKLPCPDEKKFEVVEKVKDYFKEKYENIDVDGIRIIFEEGAWGLVRASNTNPYLTVRFEARTEEKLEEIKKIVFDKLKEFKEVEMKI